MRIPLYITLLISASICCLAEEEAGQKLLERTYHKAPDMARISTFQGKKFAEKSALNVRNAPGSNNSFNYDQKDNAKSYLGVRKFLGIKNPWFGKKTYPANSADLSSKSLIPNATKEYPVKEQDVRAFYQQDKQAPIKDAVDPKPYLGKGTRPGAFAKLSEMMEKDLSVEQVREILNKNR